MKSSMLGKSTSKAEVQDISKQGVWLYVLGKEYFLSFDRFLWFMGAKISNIFNLELIHGHHLYWPELDVDLDLESLEHPHRFPLIFKPSKTHS